MTTRTATATATATAPTITPAEANPVAYLPENSTAMFATADPPEGGRIAGIGQRKTHKTWLGPLRILAKWSKDTRHFVICLLLGSARTIHIEPRITKNHVEGSCREEVHR